MLFKAAETEVQILEISCQHALDSITLRGANISIPYEMLLPVRLLMLTFFIFVTFFN